MFGRQKVLLNAELNPYCEEVMDQRCSYVEPPADTLSESVSTTLVMDWSSEGTIRRCYHALQCTAPGARGAKCTSWCGLVSDAQPARCLYGMTLLQDHSPLTQEVLL